MRWDFLSLTLNVQGPTCNCLKEVGAAEGRVEKAPKRYIYCQDIPDNQLGMESDVSILWEAGFGDKGSVSCAIAIY